MISTPHEYVALLERRGLFSPSASIPEQNTTVWAAYFDLYQQHIGSLQDVSIVVTPEGLGFYHDPLVEDPLGSHVYAWALVGAICHPILPFSPATIIASADSILDTFSRCGITRPAIITESFEMSAPPSPREENHFLWLNSPRAAFQADFQTYAASLSSSRRHHLRRLTERFSTAAGFTFDFSDARPGSGEIDFMLTNLQRRWGAGDMGYALLQTLWPISVAAVMPERARFMRVRHQGALSFLNSFILRDDVIIAQATCKNEDMSFDGLGIYIDFKTIELPERPWSHPPPRPHLPDRGRRARDHRDRQAQGRQRGRAQARVPRRPRPAGARGHVSSLCPRARLGRPRGPDRHRPTGIVSCPNDHRA